MNFPWNTLELAPEAAAACNWKRWLGPSFDAVAAACLRRTEREAARVACLAGCGCNHRVLRRRGALLAVCDCGEECGELPLTREDVRILELDLPRLGRAVIRALRCDARDAHMGLSRTRQVGALGAALPVVLTIQRDVEEFRNVIAQLASRLREHFVVLAPTARFMDAPSQALLKSAKAGFFDLESQLRLLPTGALQARISGGELFSPFLPQMKEAATDDEARRLFALLKEMNPDGKTVAAPPIEVFRLYCLEEMSRNKIAERLDCSPSLVSLRFKEIEKKLGRHPLQLRALSSQFERIEDSLSDSRAKHVHRKSAMDEADSDDGE